MMIKKILSAIALTLGISTSALAATVHKAPQPKSITMVNLSPESREIIDGFMPTVTQIIHLLVDDKQDAKAATKQFQTQMLDEIRELGETQFQNIANEGRLSSHIQTWLTGANLPNVFSVDIKDTESAIAWLKDVMHHEGVELTFKWGVENPEEELWALQIFVRANQQLNTMNYHLLGLETDSDMHDEILLPSHKVAQFKQLAEQLGLEVVLNDDESGIAE